MAARTGTMGLLKLLLPVCLSQSVKYYSFYSEFMDEICRINILHIYEKKYPQIVISNGDKGNKNNMKKQKFKSIK